MTTTLKQLEEELEALNSTMNDETDDSPEILAKQEYLLNAIMAAEAADLPALSAKQLVSHFQRRAPGQPLAKGLSKAALIAKINSLSPLTAPTPTPTPEADFSVAAYAKAHGMDGRELRTKLRAAGLRAPYTVEQVEKVVRDEPHPHLPARQH
jgi:hypothetical protein